MEIRTGQVARFTPPSQAFMQVALAPARRWFSPVFVNTCDVDINRPALLVGNHTLYGVSDVPLMVGHVYETTGVFLRSLGDRAHFRVPGWRDFLSRMGTVVGSPETCAALMQSGESIVVFPGGAREVFRRRDECYNLIWKQRTGFARLAMEHGYDIIPFASVGADETWDIVVDANDVTRIQELGGPLLARGIGRLTRGGDTIPPLALGVGATPVPRPQRYYFSFGQRISPASASVDDQQAAWSLREQVADSIRVQVDSLLRYRTEDAKTWSQLRSRLAPIRVQPGKATAPGA